MANSVKTRGKYVKTERPSLDPDVNETQMIALAEANARRQLEEGTASAQVICHYLKLGSSRARLEKEILEKQASLMDAKTESIKATANADELFTNALEVFKRYSGYTGENNED